jgi:hypothetical protein
MENITGKALYIFSRLREPSTYAALTGLLTVFGTQLDPGTWDSLVNGFAVIFGILGVFVAEAKPETQVKGF